MSISHETLINILNDVDTEHHFCLKADLRDKVIRNALKHIASGRFSKDLIAVLDTSHLRTGKSGYVLTYDRLYGDEFKLCDLSDGHVDEVPFEGMTGVECIDQEVSFYRISYADGNSRSIYIPEKYSDLIVDILQAVVEAKFSEDEEEEDIPEVKKLFRLALKYYQGDGVEEDKILAAKYWTQCANEGDELSAYNLGILYQNGDGVNKNIDKAVKWYKRAAELGSEDAKERLQELQPEPVGPAAQFDDKLVRVVADKMIKILDPKTDRLNQYLTMAGYGTLRDSAADAAEVFYNAAEQGNADAAFALAGLFEKGTGIVQDKDKALQLWKIAAKLNNTEAVYKLGQYYNDGPAKDKELALKCFLFGAKKGHVESMVLAGKLLASDNTKPDDKKEALKIWKSAVEKGSSEAALLLGKTYYFADGVEEDKKQGLKYLRFAEEHGNAEARELFRGTISDPIGAMLYSLKYGNTVVAADLGAKYAKGEGVPKDEEEAKFWMNVSFNPQKAEISEKLDALFKELYG